MQLLTHKLGGKVVPAGYVGNREYGQSTLSHTANSSLFNGTPESQLVLMSHGDAIRIFFNSPMTKPHTHLRRLRMGNGKPFSIDDGWYNSLFAPDLLENDHRRSEERRVGKECRSRWSPYH